MARRVYDHARMPSGVWIDSWICASESRNLSIGTFPMLLVGTIFTSLSERVVIAGGSVGNLANFVTVDVLLQSLDGDLHTLGARVADQESFDVVGVIRCETDP